MTIFLGTVGAEGLVTFAQSPHRITELVRTLEEKLMLPDFPALLVQLVAATASCVGVAGSQNVIAKVAMVAVARNLPLNTDQKYCCLRGDR